MPDMLAADGPGIYLRLLQDNAEVRVTCVSPGSWARLHAEDGKIEVTRLGTALDCPTAQCPVLPMTDDELAIYGIQQGIYFQDPGFNPNYPRPAEFWQARRDGELPDTPIEGVLALDPVGVSYFLIGTGPVSVGELQLMANKVVGELLNKPYLTLESEINRDPMHRSKTSNSTLEGGFR